MDFRKYCLSKQTQPKLNVKFVLNSELKLRITRVAEELEAIVKLR